MEELIQNLTQYKNLTIEIISALERENYDSLEDILNTRQKIMDNINTLKYNKEVFKEIADRLKILDLQQKLFQVMNEKRNKVKLDLNSLHQNKDANKSYNSSFFADSLFFNKKV